jgi:hypothetical protein
MPLIACVSFIEMGLLGNPPSTGILKHILKVSGDLGNPVWMRSSCFCSWLGTARNLDVAKPFPGALNRNQILAYLE